jgi:hypothetical protein
MFEFQLYTWLIALVAVGGFCWAVFIQRDVFHPLAILMPMVLYLYWYLPYELLAKDLLQLAFFTAEQWAHVQAINLLSIASLVLGCLLIRAPSRHAGLPRHQEFAPRPVRRAYALALGLGSLSLVAFAININNVGGLFEAYSVEKGGGTAESGYVRDVIFWAMPAIGLLAYCLANDGRKPRYLIALAVFAAPLLIHGLLGARRGPTFMISTGLVVAWYLGHRRRPNLLLFLGGGLALGLVLLAILTFRDQFRMGSQLMSAPTQAVGAMVDSFGEIRAQALDRTLGGSEFVYGANVMLTFEAKHDFFWGMRLLTIVFIRPIPSQIWPTKYEDVGMERYLDNVGLGFGEDMIMDGAFGAAPGFVADLYAEFSWGCLAAAFLVGLGYAAAWRGATYGNGLAMVIYLLLVALSIFFILQTMEAILFRFLFTALPVALAWRWVAADPGENPVETLTETSAETASGQQLESV